MGELEDVQTLLNKVDAAVPVLIAGGSFVIKYAKLEQGNMIYNNDRLRIKIDEYSLFLHFKSATDFGTYVLALYALLVTFNTRTAIAGYSYVAGFRNCRIVRTQEYDYDSQNVNKRFILEVTREY